MKKILCALVFWCCSTSAFAQCNGSFPTNTFCGVLSPGLPGPLPLSDIGGGGGVIAGTAGQFAYYQVSGLTVQGTSSLTIDANNAININPTAGQSGLIFNNFDTTTNTLPGIFFNNAILNTVSVNVGVFMIKGFPSSQGTNNGNIRILQFHLLGPGSAGLSGPGYTGTGVTSAAELGNEAGSTSVLPLTDELGGNTGLTVYSTGANGASNGPGDRFAVYAYAGGTSGNAVGVMGRANLNVTGVVPAVGIGILGVVAGAPSGGHNAIGGMFLGQAPGGGGTLPAQTENAALIADSMGVANIQVWRSNGTDYGKWLNTAGLVIGSANLAQTPGDGQIFASNYTLAAPAASAATGTVEWINGGTHTQLYVDQGGNLVFGGSNAGAFSLSGTGNFLVGGGIGATLTTGSQNIIISPAAAAPTTGSKNIIMGFSAGSNYTTSETGNVILGRCTGTAAENSTVQLCDGSVGSTVLDYGHTHASAVTINNNVYMSGLATTPGSKQPLCIDTTSKEVYQGSGGVC